MPDPASLPGALRRAAAGAFFVPAGFFLVLRKPRLWPYAVLPALMTMAAMTGGFVLGLFAIPGIEAVFAPRLEHAQAWFRVSALVAIWITCLGSGLLLGLALALLLTAPILERFSRRVERIVRGRASDHDQGLGWEIGQSVRSAAYFLAAAPGVFLVGLIPLVGPLLGALWGAHALSFQQTEAPLTRRGLSFDARRQWHRRWRPESLGFGLAGLVTLVVPVVNLLLTPALTAGATLFVLELESPDPAVAETPKQVT
jgi:CysZ protein